MMIAYPILESSFLHDPLTEWTFLLTLILLGIFSMNHYKKKHHGRNLPMIVFLSGVFICIIALLVSHQWHHSIMITGSLLIALGQILNFTLPRTLKVIEA